MAPNQLDSMLHGIGIALAAIPGVAAFISILGAIYGYAINDASVVEAYGSKAAALSILTVFVNWSMRVISSIVSRLIRTANAHLQVNSRK